MSEMNLTGLYPAKKHKYLQYKSMNQIYPYLLENVEIISANQVWATDITYIKLPDRFMYFSAVIDLYSRYIISYDLSHSLKIESSLLNLNSSHAASISSYYQIITMSIIKSETYDFSLLIILPN